MKKVMFVAMMAGGLFLTSCGGGGDAKADAQKLCDCMTASMENPEKAEECNKLSEEMQKKYEEDPAGTIEFAAAMAECMQMDLDGAQ